MFLCSIYMWDALLLLYYYNRIICTNTHTHHIYILYYTHKTNKKIHICCVLSLFVVCVCVRERERWIRSTHTHTHHDVDIKIAVRWPSPLSSWQILPCFARDYLCLSMCACIRSIHVYTCECACALGCSFLGYWCCVSSLFFEFHFVWFLRWLLFYIHARGVDFFFLCCGSPSLSFLENFQWLGFVCSTLLNGSCMDVAMFLFFERESVCV